MCGSGREEQKRACTDELAGGRATKVRRRDDSIEEETSVARAVVLEGDAHVESAAAALEDSECTASLLRRPLNEELLQNFAEYVASEPRWPEAEDLHPLEATWDRIAVIDFSSLTGGDAGNTGADILSSAIGYGRGLPPRFSAQVASARVAISEVMRVLPEDLAEVLASDAAELLLALWKHTNRRQFILRLELVLGDTCQKWHCDQNILRSLVTYVGPGTIICGNEKNVRRAADGGVDSVCEEAALQAATGDFLLMKGGLWEGNGGKGTAHRAPPIGPVPNCMKHRLVLKVDASQDF